MRTVFALLAAALLAAACAGGGGIASSCTGTDVDLLGETHLVVATDLSLPPLAHRDPQTGDPVGFDIDLVREVAQRMNLEMRLVDRTYSSLLPGLASRRFDVVVAGLRATPELADQACLSEPYLGADLALAVRPGSEVETAADLDARLVGVEQGSAGAAWARDRLAGTAARLVAFPTPSDPFDALRAGDVEAVIHDLPLAAHYRRTMPEVTISDEIATGDGYVFAVHQENRGLRDAIDAAVEMLRGDGTYDELHERWFGAS